MNPRIIVLSVLLILVAYQVFSGVYFKKVGIPGLFEVEFQDANDSRQATKKVPFSDGQNLCQYTENKVLGNFDPHRVWVSDDGSANLVFTQAYNLLTNEARFESNRWWFAKTLKTGDTFNLEDDLYDYRFTFIDKRCRQNCYAEFRIVSIHKDQSSCVK